MPYMVIAPEVAILKRESDYTDLDGNVIGYDHSSHVYTKGTILQDEDISPVILDKYAAEDPHTRSIMVRVNSKGRALDEIPESEEFDPDAGPKVVSKQGEGEFAVTDTDDALPTPTTSVEEDDEEDNEEEELEEEPTSRPAPKKKTTTRRTSTRKPAA